MFQKKSYEGMFTENVLMDELLRNEPTTIASFVKNVLKESNINLINHSCKVSVYLSDNMDEFCEYVFKDYLENPKIHSEISTIVYKDLKNPVGNSIYSIILRISKNISISTGTTCLLINLYYEKDPNINIRLLQYYYERGIFNASKAKRSI